VTGNKELNFDAAERGGGGGKVRSRAGAGGLEEGDRGDGAGKS